MRPGSALALAVLCVSCREQPATRSEPLAIGYSALRISLPIFVAAERGLFTRHGLHFELRRYETAQPLVEEVLDGRILAGGYAALPIVRGAEARSGTRLELAGALVEDAEHPVSRLIRRPGGPDSIAALRGRSVGILPTIAYREWLEAVLGHAGVDPADVTIIPVAPPQQAAALENGAVDALFTNDPMATAIIHGGGGELLGPDGPVPDALGELVFGSFLIHPRLAAERPEDARAVIAALDEAIDAIRRDQGAARRAMVPYVRPAERAYVEHYPPARYLRSDERPPRSPR